MTDLALTPEHRAIVLDILKRVLPAGAQVWAYGSRVTGKARPYSDLDLALELGGVRFSLALSAELAEAFDESALPFRVDFAARPAPPEAIRIL